MNNCSNCNNNNSSNNLASSCHQHQHQHHSSSQQAQLQLQLQQQQQQQQQNNSGGGGGGSNVRSSYHQKALQQIRNSLQPFATTHYTTTPPPPPLFNNNQPYTTNSSTSSSPLPPPPQQQSNTPIPPPPYSYYHALLQQQQLPTRSSSPNNAIYNYHNNPPSPPPPPLPPSRPPQQQQQQQQTQQQPHSYHHDPPQPPPQSTAAAAAAAYFYQNNGYFTPLPQQASPSSPPTSSTSTTNPPDDYFYSSRSSPNSTNATIVSSQLPPPATTRSGGIEYRAQQYPFVPSQVPMNVQQLLRRIDLTTTIATSPTRNNSPPNSYATYSTQQYYKTTSPQQQATPTPSPIQETRKKPTLIIKSTIVPKPVLQTATNVLTTATENGASSQLLRSPQNSTPPPPPPYSENVILRSSSSVKQVPSSAQSPPPPPLPPKPSKSKQHHNSLNSSSNSVSDGGGVVVQQQQQQGSVQNGEIIHTHESPIPERKKLSKEKEEERFESKVRVYSPAAFKFFMEQHVENVIKSHQERQHRRLQLESEMAKIGLSEEAQTQMRKMLSQKESNYIRLKRAKMDKSMFKVIRTIGVGAFGEVALVRKIDTQLLYAMKTLRKSDVLRRNQVAHVKAERDILAEADNEWVVKLYYSFQDKDHLYFVMDYIPGGDLMSLLIKKGIFEEPLAQFYIAELTCAIESVHKMGFIHRDIKPDNILIDRDGHIKLTDFGLCTGFRWTHNSKYYNQDTSPQSCSYCAENICIEHHSSNPTNNNSLNSRSNGLSGTGAPKVLERRRMMMMNRNNKDSSVRCLAHSLVGTPNYIAPEVLLRTGYTQLCDWWSVGVILYEMLVGQPPFLAHTPAETQFKVINWEKTLKVPSGGGGGVGVVSREARDLILKLCTDHSRRLGKNGAHQIKNHPFLYPIFHPNATIHHNHTHHSTSSNAIPPPPPDYSDALSTTSTSTTTSSSNYSTTSNYSSCTSSSSNSSLPTTQPINIRRTVAPYVPKIAHPTDTSNFDPCEEEVTDHRLNFDDEYGGAMGGSEGDNQFHGFFEFTFRRFFDDAYHLEDLAAAAAAAAAACGGDGEKGGSGNGRRRQSGGGGNNNSGGGGGGPVYV